MHKPFYASGFLYHRDSQQILLHQLDTIGQTSLWTLLSVKSKREEGSVDAFKRAISELLGINVNKKDIFPVYDYSDSEGNINFVFYTEVLNKKDFSKKGNFSWFTTKQILKLPLSSQTKQDIVVSLRVIDAKTRDLAEMATLSVKE